LNRVEVKRLPQSRQGAASWPGATALFQVTQRGEAETRLRCQLLLRQSSFEPMGTYHVS
jgi:hypothetical protein